MLYLFIIMRILGIDPGIARTGWGLIDKTKNTVVPVAFDCIETKSFMSVPQRLLLIHQKISSLLLEYEPDAMAIEELFFNTNAKTAFVVGQARGVILLSAAQQNKPIFIYTPLQVKIAVAGYGRAEKEQVGKMVKQLLGLDAIPRPDDTADALAIAITHAVSFRKETDLLIASKS